MKKVGIYSRELARWGKGTGVYTEEMVRTMLMEPDPNIEFSIISPRITQPLPSYKNVKYIWIPATHRILQDHYFAARAMNRLHLDVAWLPKSVIPFGLGCKSIITFHDLAYFLPEYKAYSWLDSFYMKYMLRRSARMADMIVAISEHTKMDAVRILGILEAKIIVIYLGVNEMFRQISNLDMLDVIRRRYNLPQQFIFYAGNTSPRKNLERLFAAFRLIKDQIPHYLVLTAWMVDSERRLRRSMEGIEDRIIRLGKVPKEDLPVIYNLASMYVHPSLYEGFGLTVIEAQACGVPVLNSNMSCMPEVGGKGAYYIDPYNVDEMARAIVRLATDVRLREQLINRGLENVRRFSWKQSARMLQDIFLRC